MRRRSFRSSCAPTPFRARAAIPIRTISLTACCGPAIRHSSISCNRAWLSRCYCRTFNAGRATAVQHDACRRAREWLDKAIKRIKPGVSTDCVCSVRPKAEAFGFPDEMSAFGLQFGHGLGLALHERPILSRVTSLTHPTEIKEGMVFALETCCPAIDGAAAAHSERKVIDNGGRVIPLFPAEELPISHRY
jgi:Xaa-Pro aminopeptidase